MPSKLPKVFCPGCNTAFASDFIPLVGTCGHTYCKGCIKQQICPPCKRRTFKLMSKNFALLELIMKLEKEERKDVYYQAEVVKLEDIENFGRPIPLPENLAVSLFEHAENVAKTAGQDGAADCGTAAKP